MYYRTCSLPLSSFGRLAFPIYRCRHRDTIIGSSFGAATDSKRPIFVPKPVRVLTDKNGVYWQIDPRAADPRKRERKNDRKKKKERRRRGHWYNVCQKSERSCHRPTSLPSLNNLRTQAERQVKMSKDQFLDRRKTPLPSHNFDHHVAIYLLTFWLFFSR